MGHRRTTRSAAEVVVAFALLCLGTSTLPAGASATPAGTYVAMGDSYVSGHGAGDYMDDGCKRSRRGYPWRYANEHSGGRHQVVFAACSGAHINDVAAETGQRGLLREHAASVRLVTIGVGGNDVGFSKFLKACIVSFYDCRRKDAEVNAAIDATAERLGILYDAVKRDLPDGGRHVRIYAVTYPQIFAPPEVAECRDGISPGEQRWIRTKWSQLNTVIRDVARGHGLGVFDVEDAFAGHEICRPPTFANGFDNDGAFHPNDLGHPHLARLLAEQIGRDRAAL
jgi:lysophospholipase L1-like esterase